MSETEALADIEAPPAESNELVASDPQSVRLPWRRYGVAALGIVLVQILYVLVLRSSGRLVHLVGDVLNLAPKLFVEFALIAIGVTRVVPPASRRRVARLDRVGVTGAVLLAIAIGVCISPALVSWLGGRGAYSKIGGVIPWSDANGYHMGALRLLNEGRLDPFNMRRPLNAGFFAVRMAVTGQNFWATMLLQGALVGSAGLLITRVVARRLGVAAGFVVAATLFAFIHPLIDLTLSESLGLTLGCLAVSALLQGVMDRSPKMFALGLLVLTIALNVRAGAYFVLPLLLIWTTLDNLHFGKHIWRPVGLGIAAVLAGFVLNMPMNAMFGTGSASTNGNFASVLYGVAHGGVGWTKAYEDFNPNNFTSDGELTNAIYRAAFSEIRHHPMNLIRGLRKGYRTYFDKGVFGFAPSPVSGGLVILTILGWAGLLIRGPTRRLGTMVLAAWAGVLLSVPFIFDDGGYRVMAVAIPILAIPPAAGVAVLAQAGRRRLIALYCPNDDEVIFSRQPKVIAAACITAVVVLVLGPPIAVALNHKPAVPELNCPQGQAPVFGWVGPQIAHVTVLPLGGVPKNFGEVTYEQFHSDPSFDQNEMATALAEIPPGSVLMVIYNMVPISTTSAFVVAPAALFPGAPHLASLCGRLSTDPAGAHYALMFADEMSLEGR